MIHSNARQRDSLAASLFEQLADFSKCLWMRGKSLLVVDLLLREVPDAQHHDAVVSHGEYEAMGRFAAHAEIHLANFVREAGVFIGPGAAFRKLFQ
jgi:hypothetical protein